MSTPANYTLRLNLKTNSRKKTQTKYNMQKLQQTDGKEGMKLELGRICSEDDPTTKSEPEDIWSDIRENIL